MSHPIDGIVIDGARVLKPDFRQYVGSNTALVVNTAASIQSMSLSARGTTTVVLAGVSYFYDMTDATSPHDGVNVLVSADGRRYKVPVALPLMQGAQNVVIRKKFPAIYAGIGFRRFTHSGVPYVLQVSYKNAVAGNITIHPETAVDAWDDTPVQTLTTNPLPEQPEVATIGTTTFIFCPCLFSAGGSYDGALKFFWRKAGWNTFQEHPQSVAGSIPVWGAAGTRLRFDGSSHRLGIAHQVSDTVNRLNPGVIYDNIFAQRFSTYLWNSGTEVFDFEDNCDGTRGGVDVDFLKTSKLGVSNELLGAEAAYYDDIGQDAATYPNWTTLAKQYNPVTRVTAYGSGGFNFANARTWNIPLEAGAGSVNLWEDDNGVTAFWTGQRRNPGLTTASDNTHFIANMGIYGLNADTSYTVLDSVVTGNSYNSVVKDIAGRKLIAVCNASSGGTPTTWFDLGWIDLFEWDTTLRRKRHICKISAPGASGIDIWERSGRVFIGWSSTANAVRTGSPTVAELTASSYIAEVLALAFAGTDGTNGTNGTNGSNGAPGAPTWVFESSTTMAAPAIGGFRLNSATISAANAFAFHAQTGDSGNPNLGAFLDTWDDSTNTVRGTITMRNISSPGAMAVYSISGNVVNNTTWRQVAVTHVSSGGTFSAGNAVSVEFTRAGDVGATGPSGASAASAVTFTPTGGVAATNVQAAIAEIDAEKLALTGGTLTGVLNGTSISMSGNITTSGGDVSGLAFNSSVTGTAEQYAMVARRSGVVRGYLAFTDTNIFRIYHYSSAGAYLSIPFETYGDGSCRFFGPARLQSYLKTALPTASATPGAQIYVSDATGGACVAFSNGTNWLRCDTSAIIS